MSVIDLSAHRAPVIYSIHVTHHWDGRVEVEVEGLAQTERSNEAVANALLTAAALAEAHGGKK